MLGENHERTKESSGYLRHLTQQAVVLQKKMNDICTNGKITVDLPPIHIQPPSMESVLDMLNAINGILFVHINQKEISDIKHEIEKRQTEDDAVFTDNNGNNNVTANDRAITAVNDDETASSSSTAATVAIDGPVDIPSTLLNGDNGNNQQTTSDVIAY